VRIPDTVLEEVEDNFKDFSEEAEDGVKNLSEELYSVQPSHLEYTL